MKFDPLKAFPYPVLRPGSNDYSNGAFQAAVLPELIGTESGLILKVKGIFNLSVAEINDLVKKKEAKYSVTLDCRDTFTRKHILTDKTDYEHVFEPGEVEGEVIISTSIVAVKNIDGFLCQQLHQDFGNDKIYFEEGSVLAQSEDQYLYVSKELFKPLTSIFNYHIDNSMHDYKYSVNLDGDQISIHISEALKKNLDKAGAHPSLRAVIWNSFYLPWLVRVLAIMDDEDQKQAYQNKKWYPVVEQTLTNANISRPINDPCLVAQKLYNSPVKLLVHELDKFISEEE